MIPTAVLVTVLVQQILPGSQLSLEEAKAEARFIVVAEVGKTGDRIATTGMSFYSWTELKTSAVLKGKVTGEELNRHPLSLRANGEERLPKTGDELLFFLGDARREFVITKVLPKTEAHLASIKSTTSPPVKPGHGASGPGIPASHGSAGGFGGGAFNGSSLGQGNLAERKPEIPPYQGTKIVPNAEAKGESLKLQGEIAAAMAKGDPVPEGRIAHFSWLENDEYMRRYIITRMGWYGGINSVEPRPCGGWVVRLMIRPWLYIPFRGYLPDYVEETYEYDGVRLRLTGSDAADAKPGMQRFIRF